MGTLLKKLHRGRYLLLMLAVPLVYLLVFYYGPIYGVQIAFRRFNPRLGMWRSPWVGLEHFERFFSSFVAWRVLSNTLLLSLYTIVAGFPIPIMLALSLNYIRNGAFQRTVQMVTYAPHFISTVVMVGLINQLLATRFGLVNRMIAALGGSSIDFLGPPQAFPHVYVWSGVWQEMGYGCIIYLAALSAIDPTLHEAAIVDGATKLRRLWHIDLPGILPTVFILLILRMGRILDLGFEKIFLMQSPLNLRVSEVIATHVYKVGLAGRVADFSYGTAIGLFQSLVGLVLLLLVNAVVRRTRGMGL